MSDLNPAPRRRTQAQRMQEQNQTHVPWLEEKCEKMQKEQTQPWEDTQTLTGLPLAQHRPSGVLPHWVWAVVAGVLTVVMVLSGFWGYRQWRAWEERRAQARLERQLQEEKDRYKLVYRDLIEKYAWERGIQPAFIAAIIYCESRFDPQALSEVGAMGLMQIRDSTGEWIAEKLGEKDGFTSEKLYDPETNIRYGTWYLQFLKDLFGNDLVKIAAGYHAGQGAVASWLENPEYSPDGENLRVIPYADTKQYVERVRTAYEMYLKHHYNQEN